MCRPLSYERGNIWGIKMNYYGSEQFKKFDEEENEAVFSHIDFSMPYENKRLDGGYVLQRYYYAKESRNPFIAQRDGEVCRLYKDSELAFEWKCYGERSNFDIIDHSNGKKYLVFKEALYGYGVFDFETGEAVHYLPWESYQSGDDFNETFIWVKLHYDKSSDLLAVVGCYWAVPYSVIVLDFSDPMKIVEQDRWLDLSEVGEEYLKPVEENKSYVCYPIDFVSWEKDRIVCSSFEIEKNKLFDLIKKEKQ